MSIDLQAAHAHLLRADPIFAPVVERLGLPQLHREPDAWRALSSSIIGQQISTHAARAVRGRFAALVPGQEFPLPAQIAGLPDETLRAVGLSRNKMLSIRGLASRFDSGELSTPHFADLDDDAIIAALLPVRGIGQWTAEMFLIFSLGRPDVLSCGDLGLRNAMVRLYALDAPPKPAQMEQIAEPWRPFRSVASWYLWRWLDEK